MAKPYTDAAFEAARLVEYWEQFSHQDSKSEAITKLRKLADELEKKVSFE